MDQRDGTETLTTSAKFNAQTTLTETDALSTLNETMIPSPLTKTAEQAALGEALIVQTEIHSDVLTRKDFENRLGNNADVEEVTSMVEAPCNADGLTKTLLVDKVNRTDDEEL